jgi:hypothetical protein
VRCQGLAALLVRNAVFRLQRKEAVTEAPEAPWSVLEFLVFVARKLFGFKRAKHPETPPKKPKTF